MTKQHHNGQELVDPSTIEIDPELQHLVPKHRKSEVALLERSLQEEKGCREALHVWDNEGKLILLDGHTRRELCIKLGFKVPIRKVQLADKEAAKAYVKKVQLGRRNTPDHAESYLRGSHYNELREDRGGDRRSKPGSTVHCVLQNRLRTQNLCCVVVADRHSCLSREKVATFVQYRVEPGPIYNPEHLQSEEYQIQEQTLQMISTKSSRLART